MDNNWKQDPRLMAMDPEKVTLLTGICRKNSSHRPVPVHASFSCICQEANAKVCNLQILKPPFL